MSTKKDIPPRPDLTRVKPANLERGVRYLIEGPFSKSVAPSRLTGVFKKNLLPIHDYQCTMTSFSDAIGSNTPKKLRLQSSYYRYYAKDAKKRAATRIATQAALASITGDPDFVYTPNSSKKPSASRIAVAAPDHSSTVWSTKHAALAATAHKALEKRINAAADADGKRGGKTMRNRRRRRGCRSLKNKNRRNYSKRRY